MCRSHRVRSRARVTYRAHVKESRTGGMQVAQGNLHLQMGGVIIVQTLRVKCRFQLIVRLKANKCYQELLRSLSSYINLLDIKLFAQVSSLCVSATDNVTVTIPGFVLIILLVILF